MYKTIKTGILRLLSSQRHLRLCKFNFEEIVSFHEMDMEATMFCVHTTDIIGA